MNLFDPAQFEQSNNPVIVHYEVAHWNENEGIVMPGWYFWEETYATRQGPFPDYHYAQAALDAYCFDLYGGES